MTATKELTPAAVEASPHLTNIVNAAIKRFAQNGFHGTTMRDIGAEVGVHAGSLYVHISSKDALLELVVRHLAQNNEGFISEVAESDASPLQKLQRIAVEHFNSTYADPDRAVVFQNEWRHLRGEALEETKTLRSHWVQTVRSIIQDGIDEGLFRQVDVRLAVLAYYSVLNSALQPVTQPDLSPSDIALTLVDFLVQGWAAPAGAADSAHRQGQGVERA